MKTFVAFITVTLLAVIGTDARPNTKMQEVQRAQLIQIQKQCPCPCTCELTKHKTIVADCSYQDITSIPQRFPRNTNIVKMSGNILPQLGNDIFNNRNLSLTRELILTDMTIKKIKMNAFRGMKGLKKLDLSFNEIESITIEAIPKRLRLLDLRGNVALPCLQLQQSFQTSRPRLRVICHNKKRRALSSNGMTRVVNREAGELKKTC